MSETTIRWTRLRDPAGKRYARLHRRIPRELWSDLVTAGVARWRIIQIDEYLLHVVETRGTYAEMTAHLDLTAKPRPMWDAAVASLIENEAPPSRLIWEMSPTGQNGEANEHEQENPL